MNNPDTSRSVFGEALLTLELNSVVNGYRGLALVSQIQGVRVLDATVLGGGRFWILCSGQVQCLNQGLALVKKAFPASKPGLIAYEILESHQEQVLNLLYSLEQNPIEESFFVLQFESVSTLLKVTCDNLAGNHVKPVELKAFKSSSVGGYAIFTGNKSNCTKVVAQLESRVANENLNGSVCFIETPSTELKRFLNLDGQV